MKTVRKGTFLIPTSEAQQQESQDEEVSKEVKSAFSKDANSETQDTARTASWGSKEKGRVVGTKLSERNDMFREQETRVVHSAKG